MMKKIITISLVLAMSSFAFAETWIDPETGIVWNYSVVDDGAFIETSYEGGDVFAPMHAEIVIPSRINGLPVYGASLGSFYRCANLEKLIIPPSLTNFSHSSSRQGYACQLQKFTSYVVMEGNMTLMTVDGLLYSNDGRTLLSVPTGCDTINISPKTETIAFGAFANCGRIGKIVIPPSVRTIFRQGISHCAATNITFLGDAPTVGFDAFGVTPPADLVLHAKSDSKGWIQLAGVPVVFDEVNKVALTITNIVVHYIQTSEQSPMTAPITEDAGIVNVITEIKGGNVAIPEAWVSNYPTFTTKYGSDFSAALTKLSGKKDAAGNPMMVWQDYVAGTDPTDEKSVFRASVTMVDGVPVVSYTPELTAEEKAKRKYTTLGKVRLQDSEWVEVTSGREADYNFFKVTVEMK